jgi:hypothetical protein
MVEFHPFANVFDEEDSTELKVRYRYFGSEPARYESEGHAWSRRRTSRTTAWGR